MWSKKPGKTSGHGFFVRLLVPNMLLLLVALTIGYVFYNKTLVEMEKEVTTANLHLLQQTGDILDRRLAEVSAIALQLANDTRIMQLTTVTKPFEGANTFRVLDTRKSIYNFSLSNNFIFSYFIVYKNSELVLAESSTYLLPQFQSYFSYNRLDSQAWRSLFIGDDYQRRVLPAQDVTVNGTPYSLLTYIQSLGYPGYPQGAIAITVDNREIQKLLGGLDLSGGGWAYIINEAGEVVSSISAPGSQMHWIDRSSLAGKRGSMLQEIGGEKMMVTYTTSQYNGWTYLVAQPAYVVLKKVLYIKKMTFAMALVFLAVGLLLSYFLAYRNSRPLKSIMETIIERTNGEGYNGSDGFHYIRSAVSRLLDNNEELQQKMEKQAPLLQAALMERLLKGEFVTQNDMPVLMQHVGIDMQGDYFMAAIIQLRGYDKGLDRDELEKLAIKRVMVKDIVRDEIGRRVRWHDVAEDQIALVFALNAAGSPDHRQAYIDELIGDVGDVIRSRLDMTVRFGLGGMYDGLLDVSRSYEEAKRALEYLAWRNMNGMMRFEDLPKESSGYYYPSDLEQRLGNLAKAGEQGAVSGLLEELYRVNFEERHLTVPMLRLFKNEMWGTIIKLLPQVGIEEDTVLELMRQSGDPSSLEGLEKNYRALEAVYSKICEYVHDHKKSQNQELLERIVGLLHEEYGQHELCLDSVAERMNISKGYLSQFFKEQKGVNFSDYLEQLRMEQAKDLLAHTDMAVYEIASHVGYSSSNTFCRAFKRIHAVSTTEYRRLNAKLKAHS